MKTYSGNMVSRLFTLLAALTLMFAQAGAHAQPAYGVSQPELDQMLAPIALYPDALLSQILMAATYPLEVAEAARWSKARPGLSGDEAVRAAEGQNWDPSVKSLVAFPQVLERMDENPQWTQALGDAFLDQQAQVMDTVQALRRRAQAAGSLRSDDRLRVEDSGSGLMVEEINPELFYVPYYDPLVVYGSWWWPAYPPVYWRVWPGYYARPGYARGFYWGPPVGLSAGFFFGAFDWHRRQVRVAHVNSFYFGRGAALNRPGTVNRAPGAWQHEPDHRRGIAYRGIEAQRRFGAASAQGNRAIPSDARRADERSGGRSAAPPVFRPEAPSAGRRPDARAPEDVRDRDRVRPVPAAQSAPAMQTAPADTRFDRRRENRNPVQTAPAAQPAPAMQPAPADTVFDRRRENRNPAQAVPAVPGVPADARFDRRRERIATMQSAPPAPVVQRAPAVQAAPAMRPAPAMQAAPVVHPAPVLRAPPAAPSAPAPAPGAGQQERRARQEAR
jgi:hypothetical protein